MASSGCRVIPGRWWDKLAGELVLQCISDDDGPFLRETEGNAASRVSGEVSDADVRWV